MRRAHCWLMPDLAGAHQTMNDLLLDQQLGRSCIGVEVVVQGEVSTAIGYEHLRRICNLGCWNSYARASDCDCEERVGLNDVCVSSICRNAPAPQQGNEHVRIGGRETTFEQHQISEVGVVGTV